MLEAHLTPDQIEEHLSEAEALTAALLKKARQMVDAELGAGRGTQQPDVVAACVSSMAVLLAASLQVEMSYPMTQPPKVPSDR